MCRSATGTASRSAAWQPVRSCGRRSSGRPARTAPSINPRGFKVLLEFIGRNKDLTVTEVGYTFRNRTHGETKLNGSVIRSYLLGVAELRLGRQVDPVFLLYVLVGLVGGVVVFMKRKKAAGEPKQPTDTLTTPAAAPATTPVKSTTRRRRRRTR